jgi:PPOX class probable F420-dependent enzyme
MTAMSKKEIMKFIMEGTFTGKLATINEDGSSHIAPVWFILDNYGTGGGTTMDEEENILFTTSDTSVKAKNMRRDNRVSICVDDQTPPFSFVTVYGIAEIFSLEQKELFNFATKIAERYMGKDNAELYGKRNSSKGEVLAGITPTRIIAEKDIAAWD